MKIIFAPWRYRYILESAGKGRCFICDPMGEDKDMFIYSSSHSVVIANRYPYTRGHVLIAPKTHVGNIEDLSVEEATDLYRTLQCVLRAVDGVLRPHYYSIGVNMGRAAGAGLEDHVHIHVIPRWCNEPPLEGYDDAALIEDMRTVVGALRRAVGDLCGGSGTPNFTDKT